MAIPKIRGQFAEARVEEIGILQHLVVEVILGGETQRMGLDPHVDVFRDEDDAPPRMRPRELHDDRDDVVVRLAAHER